MPMCQKYLRIILLTCLFTCMTYLGYAGVEPIPGAGARAISLGKAYVGVWGDFWSLFYNPAGIVGVNGIQAGAYIERRFGLKELTFGSAGLVMPFKESQAVGLDFSSFGFDAYRENKVGMSYAIQLFDVLSIGAKVNYASVNIASYGSTSAFFVDIGLNTVITEQLSLGVNVYNVNRSRLIGQSLEEDIPTVFTAGIAYRPSAKVMVVADVQKDIDHQVSFRGGIEYVIIPALKARIGVSNEPLSWNAGLGFVFENLNLDLAFGYTDRLGYTPHLSLAYAF